jgi:hypothetical protein
MDKKQLITEYVDKHVIGGALLRDATATHVYNRVKPGNEKTPYINQFGVGLNTSTLYREIVTKYAGAPYRDLVQIIQCTATPKAFVEAINIYSETLAANNIYLDNYEIKVKVTAYREYDNLKTENEMTFSGNGTIPLGEISPNSYSTDLGYIQKSGLINIGLTPLNKLDKAIPTPQVKVQIDITGAKIGFLVLRDDEGNNVDYVEKVVDTNTYMVAGETTTSRYNPILMKTHMQTEIRSAYYSWECRDPRQNSDPSDWDLFKGRINGELTEAGIPNLGSANRNAAFNPEEIIE